MEKPNPSSVASRGVPDRRLLPVHLQPQPPFDHAADAIEHPLSSPFAAQRNSPSPPGSWPASRGWLRSLRPARATPIPPPHSTFGPSRPLTRSLAGTTTSADFCPVSPHVTMRAAGAATPQHNQHPGRSPRIRTINFPLRPPRLRDDPVDGDGLYLLEQAHPDRPASYAVRVPRCRVSPRASFPPRLTLTQLPPARS